MIPAWENLDEFFSTDDFAVLATIQPYSGAPAYQIKGHFDDPYINGFLVDALDRDDVKPQFVCKFSDVRNVVRFDTLTVGGVTYDILTAPQGQGVGLGVLMLAKQ